MTMVQKRNMSLDNASQPFRPRHDELVPSRYALKVGEIDVLVVTSRPSAMWRSTATSFVGYRAPGSTDRLLG